MIGRKQRLMNQYWPKAKSLVLVISGYMLNQGEKIVATHHEYNRPSVITIVTKWKSIVLEFVQVREFSRRAKGHSRFDCS